ncbi:MAG: hypothetical protein LC799_24735, partial [Actinobacteria bacterium]|nr:hypothetical protein [Actinomycetota bacterium]
GAAIHRADPHQGNHMKYRDAAAFRQALERRLKERAAGDGARLAHDRKRTEIRVTARALPNPHRCQQA